MDDISSDQVATPFHRGELEVQERLGVREKVHAYAPRFIRDHLPEEHREFYTQLPQLIVGSLDEQGRPWASMLVGRPGFISTPDVATLKVTARPLYGDPLNDNLKPEAPLGFLGIEFHTRRRNRVNGKVTKCGDGGFEIAVDQAFGNCPQYIQARGFEVTEAVGAPELERPLDRSSKLGKAARLTIESADTLFIASMYSEDAGDRRHGVDVSHRGGKPGFVRVVDERTLVFPDFSGNYHFNTLGNIALYPKAGLLFPDFTTGDLLYITGAAEIVWEGEDLEAFEGAEQLVRITVDEVIRVEESLPLRWDFQGYAPDLARTGSWQDVAETLEAGRERNRWRRLTLARIEKESETISSFYLTPEDGKAIASYRPGQYLPIRLDIPGEEFPADRTYTVSEAPNGKFYRLSIKRETTGLVSRHFHDHMRPGSVLEAIAPRGKFTLSEDSNRPVVLLSGGVGITPMIAMLGQLLFEGERDGAARPIYFLHGTHDGAEHAFGSHIRKLASAFEALCVHIRYAKPRPSDRQGIDYDSRGYIDLELLKSILPLDDYDFYLCGPPPFMKALYEGLTTLGVGESRIHYESFGPAMVLKPSEQAKKRQVVDHPAAGPISVCFAKSGIETEWQPEKGTLLELAEAEGLSPAFSCRGGLCGTCATRIKCGAVDYLDDPVAVHDDDEVLICCSTPRCVQGEETCGQEFGVILDL
jgi:ferredoxin-NADP reductase